MAQVHVLRMSVGGSRRGRARARSKHAAPRMRGTRGGCCGEPPGRGPSTRPQPGQGLAGLVGGTGPYHLRAALGLGGDA